MVPGGAETKFSYFWKLRNTGKHVNKCPGGAETKLLLRIAKNQKIPENKLKIIPSGVFSGILDFPNPNNGKFSSSATGDHF